ncbi:putative C-S lyase [Photobacterium gaetbulicola]|uniref:cysteine-S-conjugate beta-lyase n=1 Tax=Photobacterium gaetbulicola Gung47 TaxID=658445 RepID=A0A0C5WNP6_9GAMM|nr:PatB family C-S lyase [Photobacterium gaetbulicola]AJR07987.1 aminotransferase, class II [Photobacterium gaetbulicola Gung47]PSU07794.1 putative C-S lyase [Photobacterium gaetbulicola]
MHPISQQHDPLFDQYIDRTGSNSIKWQKYQGQDVLPMWVADSDFKVPQAITDALHNHVDHGIFGYGSAPTALTELIIERMQRLYRWHVEPEWIVYLPGLVCGINLAVRSVCNDKQGVACPSPIYPPFKSSAKLAKRPLSKLPVEIEDKRWLMSLDDSALLPDTRLLLFCNPLNPGGTVYRRDELQAVADFANQQDLIVCSDEIHCDLILEPGCQHIPFASLSEEASQRSITLLAPSKTFNIAGLGASMAIIPNSALRRDFIRTKAGIVPDVNVLAYTAAQAAYEQGQPWLDRQLAYLRRNKETVEHAINAMPFLSLPPIEGTYLAWIDATKLPVASPFKFFEQAGVGLSPGADFGNPDFVRLNFACRHQTLLEALGRMEKAVMALENEQMAKE